MIGRTSIEAVCTSCHGRGVKKRTSLAILALLVAAAGCVDDTPFLGLDKLCPLVAERTCEAKQGCCADDTGDKGCEAREEELCDAALEKLTAESDLSYNSEHADAVSDELEAELRSCKPGFALSRFFEGGRAKGAACTADTQCTDGLCLAGDEGERKCGAPMTAPLCARE